MSHIREYRLLISGDSYFFTAQVNDALTVGWELHGPTNVLSFEIAGKREIWYFQAIVKLKNPTEE
jgi:hypothetical protein